MRQQMHMWDALFIIDGSFRGDLSYVDIPREFSAKYEYAVQHYGETRRPHVFSSRRVFR